MVNYMLDTTVDLPDYMIDASGTGISVKPWDKFAQQWANITTLTPTITGRTMFQFRHQFNPYPAENGERTLIDLIHREPGWTNILYVKPFTVATNSHLNALQTCMFPGDTIQINVILHNSIWQTTSPILVSLLYTQPEQGTA